jgi:hypothetical protein
MKGWIYRRAVGLKDFGERHKMRRLVALGLAIRDWVLDHSTVDEFMIAPHRGGDE